MSSIELKQIGDRYYQSKEYNKAIESYSTAIQNAESEDVNLPMLYSNRCACYMSLNQYTTALDDATSCIQLKPTWSKAYSRQGNCLFRLNRVQDAISAFEKALQYEPNIIDAQRALQRARSRMDGSYTHPSSSHTSTSSPFANLSTNPYYTMIVNKLTELTMKAIAWWTSLTQQQKLYGTISIFAVILYLLFFRGSSSSTGYYDGYSSGAGAGHAMSWTTWGLIMAAAYKIPPMFPDLLGDYARPFFGMNMTTFMWLVDMINRNRSGGGGRGMYNRRRPGYY